MEAPRGGNNKHKPIVAVNDYHLIDGPFAPNTDAKALSIGWAQFDNDDLSMKVWRHTGKQWSPQSEELPFHRNLDLTIFLLHILFDEGPNPDSFLVAPKSQIEEVENNGMQIIRDYYNDPNVKKYLEPRLKEMRELLNKMK